MVGLIEIHSTSKIPLKACNTPNFYKKLNSYMALLDWLALLAGKY